MSALTERRPHSWHHVRCQGMCIYLPATCSLPAHRSPSLIYAFLHFHCSFHALVCLLSGYHELHQWVSHPNFSFQLDGRNTPMQSALLQYSLSYLIADSFYYLLFESSNYLFMAHHILAGTYLFACLRLGVGGISAIFVFFVGEITSPLFNIFNVAKELKNDHPLAARILEYVSPVFTFSFVVVRSLISPVLIGWFLYVLWFRSVGIPTGWRVVMGICVALGLAGSQIWSYKLIRGWRKRTRGTAVGVGAVGGEAKKVA